MRVPLSKPHPESIVVQFDSLSLLGEGWGEGLVNGNQNNSPGFSPLSGRVTLVNSSTLLMLAKKTWRAEARSNLLLQLALRPSPHPLPKGEGVKLYHYQPECFFSSPKLL